MELDESVARALQRVEDEVAAQMLAHEQEAQAAAAAAAGAGAAGAGEGPSAFRMERSAGPEEMVVASLQREESILSAIPVKDDWHGDTGGWDAPAAAPPTAGSSSGVGEASSPDATNAAGVEVELASAGTGQAAPASQPAFGFSAAAAGSHSEQSALPAQQPVQQTPLATLSHTGTGSPRVRIRILLAYALSTAHPCLAGTAHWVPPHPHRWLWARDPRAYAHTPAHASASAA